MTETPVTTAPGCRACGHRLRADIDVAMISGSPVRKLEKQYGISKSALQRHREMHLEAQIRKDAEKAGALEPGAEPILLDKLTGLAERFARIAKKAEANKNFQAAIAATKEEREIVEMIGRVRGEILPQGGGRGDTTLILAMDPNAADRALSTWAQRRGALPPAPGGGDEIETIETQTVNA